MKNIYFWGIEWYYKGMKLIKRPIYLNQLISLYGTPDIKVITGVRRSGKSVLMKQYAEWLKISHPTTNVIQINMQELENDFLADYHHLHTYALEHFKKGCQNVLIIDEIQLCPHFELAINSLYVKEMFDMYVTGSNAFLLSSDLATLFTGRTMQVEILPFSFSEFLLYTENNAVDDAFDAYCHHGGFPGSYVYSTEKQKYDYVKDVYQTIVFRDLVQKYRIRNKQELLSLSSFLMDNIGNLTSPKNISEALCNEHGHITSKTVANYIGYLENAFVFYKVDRYDIKGKRYLQSNTKHYLVDPSIRYAVLGTKNMDYGRMYENLVYLELMRRGYEVYVGKLYTKEVDFVVRNQNSQCYIQVCDDISTPRTLRRECVPLLSIKDAYPKMILARTHHETYDKDGIIIQDLARWMAKTE
jgi:predicted AAA+ superfamily ATPase